MTRKKKVMIIVFSVLGAVIIALSAVLTAAAIMGRSEERRVGKEC